MIKKQFIVTMIVDEKTIGRKNTSFAGNNDSVDEYIYKEMKRLENKYEGELSVEEGLKMWGESIKVKELMNDDTRDIAIRCLDSLINNRIIHEDLSGDMEFEIQDIIHNEINEELNITEDDVCPICDQYPYSDVDNHCPVCFDEIKGDK